MSIETLTSIQPIASVQGKSLDQAGALGDAAVPFSNLLSNAIQDVNKATQASEGDAYDLVMGTGTDLHTIMIRSAVETATIETAVELTSRVVSAYKEIMQMQI